MIVDQWSGCYPSRWKGMIVPEAMTHPAKFSSRLIRRIYEHMVEVGWLKAGDVVIDPFGGVALGALDAMRLGLSWRGVELEERFMKLGNENIALWNREFSRMPRWSADALLLQGDSRELGKILDGADGVVSSPPYADGCAHTGGDDQPGKLDGGEIRLPGLVGAISSPPYSEARIGQVSGQENCGRGDQYGNASAQLGAMKASEEAFRASISSPPFRQASGGANAPAGMEEKDPGFTARHAAGNGTADAYGKTNGQLANMSDGSFDAAVSSPPYENADLPQANRDYSRLRDHLEKKHHRTMARSAQLMGAGDYGSAEGQLGQEFGDDFWSAARQIVEQVYLALEPGGHAAWVVKDFVKNKERVPFCDQWRQLCEAVGFVTLHKHEASMVNGKQYKFDGGMRYHESKSFFRRLAEKNGSPRIDYEVVWCMEKS